MNSILRPLLIRSRNTFVQCSVRTMKAKKLADDQLKSVIKAPPRLSFKWTDEQKFPYELINPYKEQAPEPEPRQYDESTTEWHYVERLLPKLFIPEPKVKGKTPSGWQPQSDELPKLPYYVNRSRNHMYPVYLEIKNGGTRKFTFLKHIQGDIWILEKDLKSYLETKHNKPVVTQVHEPVGGVRFKGDFCEDVKEWLGNAGF